ncbi:MAG: hypothetical protein GX751_05875, partial [Desulfuromonadaceae bacterium]|nr:hypothetical protein [Desulfuromonadaceae bacterium]
MKRFSCWIPAAFFWVAACLSAGASMAAMDLDDIQGVWRTTKGDLDLRLQDSSTTGTYAREGGTLAGELKGDTLAGYWTENTSAHRCSSPKNGSYYWGRFRFRFTNNDRFEGVWGHCENPSEAPWDGEKILPQGPKQGALGENDVRKAGILWKEGEQLQLQDRFGEALEKYKSGLALKDDPVIAERVRKLEKYLAVTGQPPGQPAQETASGSARHVARESSGKPTEAVKASWFRRGQSNDGRVDPAEVRVDLRRLHDKTVFAERDPVTVKVDSAEVVIPPEIMEKPEVLVLARAVSPAPLPVKGLEAVVTWQVSLGEHHVFDKPLTLRFQLPPETVQRAAQRNQPLAAMYFHETARAWVYTPVSYDAETGQVEIRTRHLTLLTIVLRPVNNLIHDAVYTDHFALFYSKETILTDTEVNEGRWSDKLVNDLESNGEPIGLAHQVDSETIVVEGRNDVPTYIVYMAKALEYAWHRYKDLGFNVPEWTRTDIYVGVNSPLSDENHRGKLLGTIEITPTATWRPTTLRANSAHEFFHTVQAEYLGMAIMSMNYRTWWLEALAEFAPRTVWGLTVAQKGMQSDFFKLPLTTVDGYHEYACSQFVRFMVSQKGIDFRELTVETLSVPSGLLAMEEISAPDFALFKKLLGVDHPFETYTVMVTCGMIDRFLRARGTTLADAYAEFVAWALLDDTCKKLVSDSSQLLDLAAQYHTIGGLALDDEKIEGILKTSAHGTADIWALSVENPIAEKEEKPPARRVTVEVEGDVASLTRVNAYVLKDNNRSAAGAKPAASLSGANPSAEISVGAGDMLYLVAANSSDKAAEVKVRVLSNLDFRIEPAAAENPEALKEATFHALADVVPKDIEPDQLKVRWRPVPGIQKETPVVRKNGRFTSQYSHAWPDSGDYTLRADLLANDKPIAAAQLPIRVNKGREPGITLEARNITVPAGKDFTVSASVANVPKGATYTWQIDNHQAKETTAPQAVFMLPSSGTCRISVQMITSEGRVVAFDKATLTVEGGGDVVWVEDSYKLPDGSLVVVKKYQVFRGTLIKHGQWMHFYPEGPHAGALKERRTYEQNVRRKSEEFHPDGKPQQIAHFDEKERYHG